MVKDVRTSQSHQKKVELCTLFVSVMSGSSEQMLLYLNLCRCEKQLVVNLSSLIALSAWHTQAQTDVRVRASGQDLPLLAANCRSPLESNPWKAQLTSIQFLHQSTNKAATPMEIYRICRIYLLLAQIRDVRAKLQLIVLVVSTE